MSLETCFLQPASTVDLGELTDAARGRDLLFAWGAPDGLAYGTDTAAFHDALRWLDHAAAISSPVMGIMLGGPSMWRGEESAVRRARVVPMLEVRAEGVGV